MLLTGRIECRADVAVEVTKYLDARRSRRGLEVRGFSYMYRVFVRDRLLLRYGNCHEENDPDEFHRHVYDRAEPREDLARRLVLRRHEFPTLIRVIEEVQTMITDEMGITINW